MEELMLTSQLEPQTKPYCVHIADETGMSLGSGLLYYPGEGKHLYVFTCAHVVWDAKSLSVHILLPENPDQDEYCTYQLVALPDQIRYSPLDQVSQGPSGETIHSHDVAVIALEKENRLHLALTNYFVAEARHHTPIYIQGYPGGWFCETDDQVEALDWSSGIVLASVGKKPTFEFRIDDRFLDMGNRAHELKGFSGAPVWDASDPGYIVFGLVAAGKQTDVYRGRVKAAKMRFVQSIMKNEFGIQLETKIPGIPEDEVADKCMTLRHTSPIQSPIDDSPQDAWAFEQEKKLRALIDDLKMKQAIDLGCMLIDDVRYQSCSKESRIRLMKYLIYCYNTCLLEEDAQALELCMRQEGLIETHVNSQWMSYLFGAKKYEELLQYTESLLDTDKNYLFGKFLGTMAKAFVRSAPPEETVGLYVDDRERLREPAEDTDTEAFYLQVIGFVYIDRYQMPEKAIRCLNLSYRLNNQSIVLETLGCAYYQLALKDASTEEGRFDPSRINHAYLYKARSCFLILMEKEDELCFRGAIKRIGWLIFHTFVYSLDFYRVMELYPWMRDHFPFQKIEDRRAVEKHYAYIISQNGKIDLAEFSALTEEDKLMLQTSAEIYHLVGQTHGLIDISTLPKLEVELRATIAKAEWCMEQLDTIEALPIRYSLIDLYCKGIHLFGWNVLSEIKRHQQLIVSLIGQQGAAEIDDLIFELEHTYEENIRHFQEAYEKAPSLSTWNALTQVHIHFGAFDTADARYLELFREHEELYREVPEHICRACLDYVREYRRNLRIALWCYMIGKDKFDDKDILRFWELELMLMTCTFNKPERFEEERQHFFEQKLIDPEGYYRSAMIAYMENLDEPNASRMFQHLPLPKDGLTREVAFYLAWQRQLRLPRDERRNEFAPRKIKRFLTQYKSENWSRAAGKGHLMDRFKIERTCCLDAWTLYLLAESGTLAALEDIDTVYIPHCTINHLLYEISLYPNEAVHLLLDHICTHKNISILSANFEYQLKVRDRVPYDEPASVVAVALEKDCLAVIGTSNLNKLLIDAFSNRMVRPTDIFSFEQQLGK